MRKTLPTLDNLIDHVWHLNPDASELDRVRDAVAVGGTMSELGDHLVGHFIDEARAAGTSWAVIGEHLGISRQAVQKRYSAPEAEAAGKGLFDRMVPDGKFVIVHSQDEARARQADYIGTEHLLLGIAAEPDATGAQALRTCGASPETVIAAVNGRIGMPAGAPRTDKLPFTPNAKSILEHSLRESLRLGHDYIGTGHLALACLTIKSGIAQEILGNLGIDYDGLRKAVTERAAESSS